MLRTLQFQNPKIKNNLLFKGFVSIFMFLNILWTSTSYARFELNTTNACLLYLHKSKQDDLGALEVKWRNEVSQRLMKAFKVYQSQNLNFTVLQLRNETKILNVGSYISGAIPINIKIAQQLADYFDLELEYVLAKDTLLEFNKTEFEVRPSDFFKRSYYNLNRAFKFLIWDQQEDLESLIKCLRSCPDHLLLEELKRRGLN